MTARVRPDDRWIELGLSALRKQGLHERSTVAGALEVVLPAYAAELLAEVKRLRERVARVDESDAQWLRDLTEQEALIEQLREQLTQAKAMVERMRDSAPKEWAIRVEAERRALEAEVEQLRRELDASNEHLAGLLRRSITHQSDRDALKERKNARIRELLAEVEHLTAENESWKAMTEPMGSGDGQAILAGRSAAVTAEGREQKADRMFAAAKDEQAKQRERSGPTMIDSPGRMQAWTPSEVGFVTDPAPVVSDDPTEEREQTAAERAVEAFASEVEQRPWTPQEHTVYAMGYEAVEHARIHVNCLRCEEPFYYDSWGDESGQRHRTYLPSCECLGVRRG